MEEHVQSQLGQASGWPALRDRRLDLTKMKGSQQRAAHMQLRGQEDRVRNSTGARPPHASVWLNYVALRQGSQQALLDVIGEYIQGDTVDCTAS